MDASMASYLAANGPGSPSVGATSGEGYVPMGEFGSKKVPNVLAAMVVGSVVTLVALRAAGFRFSFGVNVGGGS